MSNLCIIKILFEQMSQEASGLVSQAGAAKFFWPSVAELGVSVLLAPAGITVVVREPCLPVGTEGRLVLPSPVGMQLCSEWFSVHSWRGLWEVRRQPLHTVHCSSCAGHWWLPSGTGDTPCCCVCAVESCQEASEELEGWWVSVLGCREAESHGCRCASVKQGRRQFSKQLMVHVAPCGSSAPLPHHCSPLLRAGPVFPGPLALGEAAVPSCAWSYGWQSLPKLLEPNWLTREGSGAGGHLQDPPSPCRLLQKLLQRRSEAAAECFCLGAAFCASCVQWS